MTTDDYTIDPGTIDALLQHYGEEWKTRTMFTERDI